MTKDRAVALLRLVAFLLLAFVVFPLKARVLPAALLGGDVVGYLVDHAIELVALLVFVAVATRLERRQFGDYGLPWGRALRREFWIGAAAGVGGLAVLVGTLQLLGAVHVSLPAGSAIRIAGFGLVYAVLFVLLGLREEFLYRGYGLRALTDLIAFWPAAVASSAWFFKAHGGLHNESLVGLVNVGAFGLVSCLALRRTGSLWMAIGFHSFWNWGESFLFGVGDSGHAPPPGHFLDTQVSASAPAMLSGGAVGPEGSVLCTLLIVLLGVLCAWKFREVRFPKARVAALPLLVLLVALAVAAAPHAARPVMPRDLPLHEAGPDSFVAEFTTTKGTFAMHAVRAWSPQGVDRLYHLVKGGYFDGLTIYRVGETKSVAGGRVVQFGQSGDTAASHAWDRTGLADEPALHPHRPGAVGFARGGPGTRTVEIAIATNAIPALDTVHYQGVVGFPVIAEVRQGLGVLSRLEGRYGNAPIENDSLSIVGEAYLKRAFPGLDAIVRARVKQEWR